MNFPIWQRRRIDGKTVPDEKIKLTALTTTTTVCSLCNTCAEMLKEKLKVCSKCKTTHYCSAECQKADWKTHKLTCGNPSADTSSNPPTPQPQAVPNTSQGFSGYGSCHSMLQDPKEEKVFKHLIDAYRLRVEDEYVMTGDVSMDSLYGGGNPMNGFKKFLTKAEKKSGILPSWWDKKARARCEKQARSPLQYAVEKSDNVEGYGAPLAPMSLRDLAQKIYGKGVGY